MSLTRARRAAIDHRRQQVAALYLQGWKQAEIARHLDVAQATVCNDVEFLCRQWRASAQRDIALAVGMELEKLERLMREAWAGWERSQKPQQSAEIAGDQERPSKKRIRNQHGDARFLNVVHNCLASRRALLALEGVPIVKNSELEDKLEFRRRLDEQLSHLTPEEVDQLIVLKEKMEQGTRKLTLDAR